MIDSLVRLALKHRIGVLLLAVILVGLGLYAFTRLPIEGYPDVADTWVQVISQWPGHAAEEVERQVSLPIELETAGTPRMTHLRSASIFGLSVVTLIFEDGTDSYFARQQVIERLQNVVVPDGVQPNLGPLASPIGEIYRYVVHGKGQSLAELKTIQDWTIERQLRSVPGVADVVSFGGLVKQYHVLLRPERLVAHRISLRDVSEALAHSNRNAGGGFIEVGPQSVNVRGVGLIRGPDELLNISIRTAEKGTPVLVRDVADVEIGYAPRLGIVGIGTENDVVQATVLMRKGENAGEVLPRVRAKVESLNSGGLLPRGVEIRPYNDRTHLIETTTRTVLRNMIEGVGPAPTGGTRPRPSDPWRLRVALAPRDDDRAGRNHRASSRLSFARDRKRLATSLGHCHCGWIAR